MHHVQTATAEHPLVVPMQRDMDHMRNAFYFATPTRGAEKAEADIFGIHPTSAERQTIETRRRATWPTTQEDQADRQDACKTQPFTLWHFREQPV